MINQLLNDINQRKYTESFEKLYPIGRENQPKRYIKLAEGFREKFGNPQEELVLISAPGRTEIGGNHTDHQHGKVLGAAVHMDTAGVVCKNSNNEGRIYSVGFGNITVNLNNLEKNPEEENTTQAVVRGVASRLVQQGYSVGGFTVYCNSAVPVGSGLSSSAAFENFITTIFNYLYNEGEISGIQTAQIGQYAENEYFGKPSGLLDQAISAIGGLVTIDFKDNENPVVREIDFHPEEYGYTLCIVNTGGDHADLTGDYAGIFNQLKEVSGYFGKNVLREVPFEDFYQNISAIAKKFGEQAVVRSFHIYKENIRVEEQLKAIEKRDFEAFRQLVLESGNSSFTQLQNVFSTSHPTTQPISLGLSLSAHLLEPVKGAWRVHGGGFAGTIQVYVPTDYLNDFQREMDQVFGLGACQPLGIRSIGSTKLQK